VFCSIEGAKQFYTIQDTRINQLKEIQVNSVDSLNRIYNAQEAALRGEIEAINKNKVNRWGGLLSGSENKQILNYQKEIEQLQDGKNEGIKALTAKQNGQLDTVSQKTYFNIKVFAIITAINEALILIICWFMVYYDYRTAKFSESVYSEPIEFTLPAIQRLLQLTTSIPPPPGEQLVNINSTTKTPEEIDKNSEGQAATATTSLAEDLAKGIRDFRYLMNKHRVNVNTLKKAIDNHDKNLKKIAEI